MPVDAKAENICGTIGTLLWTLQVIPQIVHSYRTKSTLGLSPWLMFIWASSGPFLGVYTIIQNINIPLIIQPQGFGFLAACSWIQCLYYGSKRSKKSCALIFLVFLVSFAGFEASMIYATRAAISSGDEHLLRFFGVFSAVLISVALIPQFVEIYRMKEVKGISMLFMAVDIGGGVFSLLSLAFKQDFDAFAAVSYIAVIVLDGVIVILSLILNPRARRRREATGSSSSESRTEVDSHPTTMPATIPHPTEKGP